MSGAHMNPLSLREGLSAVGPAQTSLQLIILVRPKLFHQTEVVRKAIYTTDKELTLRNFFAEPHLKISVVPV